jgi:hypothetical protein
MKRASQSSPSAMTPQQEAEQQIEVERIQEVTFLLRQLLEREQQTVKAIANCLLEVGIINLANRRIQFRPLRPVVKPIARAAKPILVAFAYRWICKKYPPLISRWLRGKVQFLPPQQPISSAPQPTVVPNVNVTPTVVPTVVLEPVAGYQREIRQLRSRLRITGGALMGVSTLLALILAGVDFKAISQFSRQKGLNPAPVEHSPSQQDSQVSIPALRNQAVD